MTGADAAFDVLSDPIRLPEYVPALRLEDSIAIEGEADPDVDIAARDGAPAAGFIADRKTRTITWARPERDYRGSITISQRTASTSDIAVTLHTGPDTDAVEVAKVFDDAISRMRRVLTGVR